MVPFQFDRGIGRIIRRTLMPGRLILPMIAALLLSTLALPATAGEVLDRVRRDGVVRCTAEERPAVAMPRPAGGIEGLAVDLCRAVAIAVLGRGGRVAFSIDAPAQAADVAFVAEEDGAARRRLVFGPVVFVDRLAVLVPVTSRVQAPRDLAGETVCLMIGSPGHSALEAAVGRLGIDIVRLAFEEDVEMRDAYAVGRCGAMVGAGSELATLRGPLGINRLTSRLVPEPLALVPVIVATGAADRDWTSIVSWVTHVLVDDTADMPPPGVRRDWLEDVRTVLGGDKAVSPHVPGNQ
jgi:general L-amino acid transport system substrate-binding protein